ncbi:MAG TPA: hypothetical protein VFB66_09975 [Tepidisphaeraceae bacterium]|nr:hypothetical protein [Tepidisphaeraceae bacterium]
MSATTLITRRLSRGRCGPDGLCRRHAKPGRCARRAGTIALITMLYLILLGTLTLAMFVSATTNVQTSENFSRVARAQASAETGLRWMDFRFRQMTTRPKTDKGTVSKDTGKVLWPALRDAIAADLATVRGPTGKPLDVRVETNRVRALGACIDAASGATFDITVRPLSPMDGSDERFIRVTVEGRSYGTRRVASMDFEMKKQVSFAVVGKVPLQVGRNTIIDGPIAMTTPTKYPPIYVLSDFTHFHPGLKTKIQAFNAHLEGVGVWDGKVIKNHDGFDNRISVNNAAEYALAKAKGYGDYNGDAWIDEYDLFLAEFDSNRDGQLAKTEFTNTLTGKLYDENLFNAIDSIGGPRFNEDKDGDGILDTGEDTNGNGVLDIDPPRAGYKDGLIDNRDGYAKIRGQITLATTSAAWESNLAPQGQDIHDMIAGPIASPDPTQLAIKFGAPSNSMFDLQAANFEQATLNFKAKTGAAAGTMTKTTTLIANKVLAAADANGGTLNERTPYGSTSWQATYARPVFRNLTLRNVQIPKGLNALFDNCKFEGVTYVDMTRDIIKPGTSTVTFNKDDGMNWSKRMRSGTFSNTVTLTATNSYGFTDGNNLRFNDCTFEGPIAGGYATAYTHFTNTWEFTGATMFNNKVDQTATIVAPQTNMEMGSFTNPALAPSTLVGVVVAGNLDIRGSTTVDGSIIIPSDGAGNTTLSYFGDNDGATDPGAMPQGGYGKLVVRFNPYRAMPDGILTSIDLVPAIGTYREGM